MENRPSGNGSLIGKTLYIPRMSVEGASTMAAAYRALGVNGQMLPQSDSHTLDLARQYTIGEECYPEIVTLGGFLKVIESDKFEPEQTAFLMPTAGGPCRFGQYKNLLEKVLKDKGMPQVMVVAPTSNDGYAGMGGNAGNLMRLGWWSIITADALRKLLLQTRPYELTPGETDKTHAECLDLLCRTIEQPDIPLKEKLPSLIASMEQIREKFEKIPAYYIREKPLIGVVGEIYCRLDDFTNADLIRVIERFGGETWLASISEWVFYTNFMQRHNLRLQGERFSRSMLGAVIRNQVQVRDEHRLIAPLKNRFLGYEEPENIRKLTDHAHPFLPFQGSLGEMVLNTGGAIHYYHKGADGIVDISPFTCMNGIVCEAVYPKVSQSHDHIPIRNFYFDGTESDWDRDVEIFLELAHTYRKRKKIHRVFPSHF